MLWTWSQEMDRNISKTCVFILHHSIQHNEAFGYTFTRKLIAQINIFKPHFNIWKFQIKGFWKYKIFGRNI